MTSLNAVTASAVRCLVPEGRSISAFLISPEARKTLPPSCEYSYRQSSTVIRKRPSMIAINLYGYLDITRTVKIGCYLRASACTTNIVKVMAGKISSCGIKCFDLSLSLPSRIEGFEPECCSCRHVHIDPQRDFSVSVILLEDTAMDRSCVGPYLPSQWLIRDPSVVSLRASSSIHECRRHLDACQHRIDCAAGVLTKSKQIAILPDFFRAPQRVCYVFWLCCLHSILKEVRLIRHAELCSGLLA